MALSVISGQIELSHCLFFLARHAGSARAAVRRLRPLNQGAQGRIDGGWARHWTGWRTLWGLVLQRAQLFL